MVKFIQRKDISVMLTLSWMILIFYLSHQSASTSSHLSGQFMQLLIGFVQIFTVQLDEATVHFFIRKSAHFVSYFILGLLLFHSIFLWWKRIVKVAIISLFISILYAISDELHQTFIPGRSGELRDVAIDSIGSFTGIVMYITGLKLFTLMYKKRKML